MQPRRLNAGMIELFTRGIIFLTFPSPPASPFHPLLRHSLFVPLLFAVYLASMDTSFRVCRSFDVLSLFAIFRTFPRRVFHRHTERYRAFLRYFRDAPHQTLSWRSRWGDTRVRKFLATWRAKSCIDPRNLNKIETAVENSCDSIEYFRRIYVILVRNYSVSAKVTNFALQQGKLLRMKSLRK